MNITDVLISLILALSTAYFVKIGLYPQAVFSALWFFMMVIFSTTYHIIQAIYSPQPRVNIPIEMLSTEKTEEE